MTHRHPGRSALLAVLAAVALVVLAAPAPAGAHAGAIGSDPADGEVLPTAPAAVTVLFNEPVALAASGTQLLDDAGDPVEAAYTVTDRTLTIEPAATLGDGSYVVTWRVVSADTHPVSGGLTFSVGAPSATTAAVPEGTEEREVRLARIVAAGLQYGGLLVLGGVVVVVALLAPAGVRADTALAGRWWRCAVGAGAAGVGGAALLVPLTAVWESGEPLSAVLAAGTWSVAAGGPALPAAALAGAGTAGALVALRRGWDGVAVGGAGLALAALVVVGHTRSYGPSALLLATDLVHLAVAAVWLGGLVAVGVALTARSAGGLAAGHRESRALLVARFSTTAAAALALLAVTGVLLYTRIGGSLDGLWTTGYGRTLLAKSAVVLPVVGLAAWNRLRLVPRSRRLADEQAAGLLARTVRAEAMLLTGVVVLTGVLVNQTPPVRESEPVAVAIEQEVVLSIDAEHDGAVLVTPARRGVNGVRVSITDASGAPAELSGVPTLSFSLDSADLGPLRRPVTADAAGEWETSIDLPLPGEWEVSVAVPLDEFTQPVVVGRFEVP